MNEERVQISLGAARKNAGLLQTDTAKELGVTPQTVANWESGQTEPTVSQFRKMCELYNMPMWCIILPEKSN